MSIIINPIMIFESKYSDFMSSMFLKSFIYIYDCTINLFKNEQMSIGMKKLLLYSYKSLCKLKQDKLARLSMLLSNW